MTAALTIARNTFIESLRQPVIFVIVLLCGLLQYINTASTGYTMGYRIEAAGEITGDDKMLLDVGLATAFVGGILLAAFIATAALSREIDNKTVLTVISKPIGRPAVVIGKFIGVTATMAIASAILVFQLLFALRHGVMTTAADLIDWPVITFATGAFLLAASAGAFTNFMYSWSFSQVFTITLLPLMAIGYGLTLLFTKEWELQPITTDLKPQVIMACTALGGALLVITGVAVAASTRLGQVMTLVVCAGVFILGLLSNHFVGRFAFVNQDIGLIESVTYEDPEDEGLGTPASTAVVRLESPPDTQVPVGSRFFYGPARTGLGLVTPTFQAPDPSVDITRNIFDPALPPALIITDITGQDLTVKHIGGAPLPLARGPQQGDAVFLQPTRVNWAATVAWGLIPNMQAFWLVDAVTQAQPIPPTHLFLIAFYAIVQVGAMLALAIVLFEGRDVG